MARNGDELQVNLKNIHIPLCLYILNKKRPFHEKMVK